MSQRLSAAAGYRDPGFPPLRREMCVAEVRQPQRTGLRPARRPV